MGKVTLERNTRDPAPASSSKLLMASSFSSSPLLLLLTLLFLSLSLPVLYTHASAAADAVKGVDPGNPVLDVALSPLYGHLSGHVAKDALFCERVKVSGHPRLKLESYASVLRVTLAPAAVIPERLHGKILVCFHRNSSLGLCDCAKDEWKPGQKGLWSFVMSPYEERYVDVKSVGDISGSVKVTVEEGFQQWRLIFLAVGFVLLFLAPIVSTWVPFYYSTSMAIGVFLVIIVLLFQGMKLLPTGRKNFFYLSIYGSVVGAGTFVLHHISTLVNSVLVSLGLSEEMHNPVYVFVLVGIVFAGAALGFWIVRKFVISKDGNVDVGIAQFVKWAMRTMATTLIFQSTLDIPLGMVALVSSWAICFLITSLASSGSEHQLYSEARSPWPHPGGQAIFKTNRAEFLSRSTEKRPGGKLWNSPNVNDSAKMNLGANRWDSPKSAATWSNSPVKGLISPLAHSRTKEQDYYSTFHKTANRKKFSKKEWEDFTRESTRQAVAEWAASPEVTEWIIENADRIQLLPSDHSSEETMGSESDSTDEVHSGKGFSLFNW